MADNSSIEWTDATWNPIRARNIKTGKIGWHCEHATTGCEFCYAEGFNKRLGTGLPFKPGHRNDIELFLDEKMLRQPLRWKKPRTIFVGSMTDLFADFVSDAWLYEIFAVMGACDRDGIGHTFQILTKRADRMQRWVSEHGCRAWNSCRLATEAWPARNVWLGVSTERQQEADERIRSLLDTPAAVRFISAEPLLGPIDLTKLCILPQKPGSVRAGIHLNALKGNYCESGVPYTGDWDVNGPSPPVSERRKLDWVIVGGESGPGARPMSIQWVRELRDQCSAAGVPYFFKQWGEWHPAGVVPAGTPGRFAFGDYEHDRTEMVQVDAYPRQFTKFGSRSTLQRVGKKAAGRHLDGVLHNAMPGRP